MKKTFLIISLLFSGLFITKAQQSITLAPFLHQTGMYYTSGHITSDGFGPGLGVHLLHKTQVAAQADVNLLWGNGNAITTRIALGYEREGAWTPGIYGTLNLIWGQRVQLLTETGQKPPVPALVTGIRITPLKFQTKMGFVSALEFGYGFGPDKGRSIELSILSTGLNF